MNTQDRYKHLKFVVVYYKSKARAKDAFLFILLFIKKISAHKEKWTYRCPQKVCRRVVNNRIMATQVRAVMGRGGDMARVQ